jgi:16S rRNA processing protein RimM
MKKTLIQIDNQPLIHVGKIIKPHGIKGELVVDIPNQTLKNLLKFQSCYLGMTANHTKCFQIKAIRPFQKRWLLFLEGIQSMTEAETLRSSYLYLEPELLSPLEKDEYYVQNLVGSSVVELSTGKPIGFFLGAEAGVPPACDRWWIKTQTDEIAIPAHKNFIHAVDSEKKLITISNWQDINPTLPV